MNLANQTLSAAMFEHQENIANSHGEIHCYGVATISGLLQIIGLFCRPVYILFYRALLQKRRMIEGAY